MGDNKHCIAKKMVPKIYVVAKNVGASIIIRLGKKK